MKPKLLLSVLAFLLVTGVLHAQSTTVSGSVTDLGAQTWNNGTFTFNFVPNPASPIPPVWTGGPLNTAITGTMDGSGNYSVSIPSNTAISPVGTMWKGTFCPQATSPCYTAPQISVTGATQTFNVTPPAISISLINPPSATMRAYSTGEISSAIIGSQFYLLGTGMQVCAAVSGNLCTLWLASGGASIGTYTVSTLPGGVPTNTLAIVTDGPSCTVGGGGTRSMCQWNGSSWVPIGGGGSPGGVSPDDQCNLANAFSNCVNIASNHKSDPIFYAPLGNPWYDARASGYRAIPFNLTPAISGITATCNGTTTVTLSGSPATALQIGDGVLVAGCGQNLVASAPTSVTITPVTTYAVTNAGMDIALQTGATQYCYTFKTWEPGNNTATNPGTGISATSAEFCTNTGPATLGPQTANPVTAATCTHNTCALTLTNPQVSNTSGHIQLTGFTPRNINGEWNISTWTDSTHVTITVNFDVDNGGPSTFTTLGNLYYVTGNRIQVTAASGSTNGTKYLVYGRATGGTKNLIGVTIPQASGMSADRYYNIFEDYGSTYSPANTLPYYVPTTDAAAAIPEGLQTTITNVAGTTLTLTDAAVQSSSGNVFLFDNAATLRLAATAATNRGARLYIPQGASKAVTNGAFVHNGPVTLPSNTEVEYGAGWYLNDTIHLASSTIINALPIPSGYFQFEIDPAPGITCVRAFPCLDNFSGANAFFNGPLGFQIPESGIGYYQIGGGIPCGNPRKMMMLFSGLGYTSLGLVYASVHGGACAEVDFSDITATANQNGNGNMNTPAIYARGTSNLYFHRPYMSGKGLVFNAPAAAGGNIEIESSNYAQALYMPYVIVANQDGGSLSFNVKMFGYPNNDTGAAPCWSLYTASAAPGQVIMNADLSSTPAGTVANGTCGAYFSIANTTQYRLGGQGNVGMLAQKTGAYPCNGILSTQLTSSGNGYFSSDACERNDVNWSTGPAYSVGSRSLQPAAPTCTVNSGGNVPIGNVWYLYSIVPPDGHETTASLACSATTSSGNQTVNIVVPGSKLPAGFKYNYYRSVTSALAGFTQITLGVTANSNVNDTQAATNGVGLPADQPGVIAGSNGGSSSAWAPKGYFGTVSLSDTGSCTMSTGACTAQSLSRTYAAAPVCQVTWTGGGTLTGILKVASTTTTVTPSSSIGTDTAVVNWVCFGN